MTTPWPAMLRLAVGALRLPPEAFWRLSLREWRALTGEGGAEALDREGFDALTRAYPDCAHGDGLSCPLRSVGHDG